MKDGSAVDKTEKELLLLDFKMEVLKHLKDKKEANAKKREWAENGPRLYSLILQHCLKTVINKLEAQPDYEKHSMTRDPVEIIIMLRVVSHKHDSRKDETMAIVDSDV